MSNRALLLPDDPQGVFFINAFPRLTTANAIKVLCENELHTPFAMYKVNRRNSFLDRIAEWGNLNRINFSMLFINSHGGPGALQLPDGNLALSQISSVLDGNAAGRWIHFSSCSTLNIGPSRIDTFMNETGAYGISGFTHDVEHFNSLSIEIQLLKELFIPMAPPHGVGVSCVLRQNIGSLNSATGFFGRLHVTEPGGRIDRSHRSVSDMLFT